MSGRAANFYATGLAILKAGMSGFDEDSPFQEDRFVFYWTDSVTGKGTKVFVESEHERDKILQHYFEASMGPVKGVQYNSEPVSWPGVIFNRRAR
jgi:hypothetical protein